ncbi:hypothetical protein OHT59_00795 [Streptomyces sp. NBC_00243]|uniref:hypothetical protein n=1 Tax=Streptomyces sp. NBC_00243 TaxID=2975688 RepID=UPI002DDB61DA|nr:hypothetical protein [Streptomyces sp. NBC_00243]WRZ17135.1 hypothetical protein OHT59_00795 [Streptomyces sp. NBC_00243]
MRLEKAHYYAAHLTSVEPKIRAGVINAGVVKTDLLRVQSRLMKVTATVVATLFAGSVEKSARNVIHAGLRDDWAGAQYWGKPGAFEDQTRIEVEPREVQRVMAVSRELTGA